MNLLFFHVTYRTVLAIPNCRCKKHVGFFEFLSKPHINAINQHSLELPTFFFVPGGKNTVPQTIFLQVQFVNFKGGDARRSNSFVLVQNGAFFQGQTRDLF